MMWLLHHWYWFALGLLCVWLWEMYSEIGRADERTAKEISLSGKAIREKVEAESKLEIALEQADELSKTLEEAKKELTRLQSRTHTPPKQLSWKDIRIAAAKDSELQTLQERNREMNTDA